MLRRIIFINVVVHDSKKIIYYVTREKSRSWFPRAVITERNHRLFPELHVVFYSHLNCGHLFIWKVEPTERYEVFVNADGGRYFAKFILNKFPQIYFSPTKYGKKLNEGNKYNFGLAFRKKSRRFSWDKNKSYFRLGWGVFSIRLCPKTTSTPILVLNTSKYY